MHKQHAVYAARSHLPGHSLARAGTGTQPRTGMVKHTHFDSLRFYLIRQHPPSCQHFPATLKQTHFNKTTVEERINTEAAAGSEPNHESPAYCYGTGTRCPCSVQKEGSHRTIFQLIRAELVSTETLYLYFSMARQSYSQKHQ